MRRMWKAFLGEGDEGETGCEFIAAKVNAVMRSKVISCDLYKVTAYVTIHKSPGQREDIPLLFPAGICVTGREEECVGRIREGKNGIRIIS